MTKPLIIFDLDGTLYRGDDPYGFYAQQVSRFLSPAEAQDYLARVHDHLGGRNLVPASDNWEAVVRLMDPFGERLDADQWQQAFLATRKYMLSGECPLEVPGGLMEFLRALKHHALLAVASNSPQEAASPLLEMLELSSMFDVIKTAAGKPQGLVAMALEITAGEYAPGRIFSIGDHYTNDIAPGVERGWTTGHISPRGIFPGPATYQATRIEDLYSDVMAWVKERQKRGDG